MRRSIFLVLLVLLSLMVFVACSDEDQGLITGGDSDSETQADGDSDTETGGEESGDVDKDLADLDLEPDTDGDADEELTDPDEDVEPDVEPDAESDVDKIDTEPDAEPEPELEPESEIEQGPAYDIQIEEFPFEATTIVPCSDTLNKAEPYGVWGDDAGHIYFAGANDPENGVAPFWIYDEASDTFTCDSNVTETLFDVKGRIVAGQPEVWVEAANKIGRLHQGNWTFISIPDVEPMVDDFYLIPPAGIDVSAAGKVAAWGDWGLAFYNTVTEVWTKLEFCPCMETVTTATSGYWINEKFYMPGGCDLYEIDPANPACDILATLDECNTEEIEGLPDVLHAIGVVDAKLWLAYIADLESLSFGEKELFTVDVGNDTGFTSLGFDADKCSDIWGRIPYSPLTRNNFTMAMPGSAGTPILFEVFLQSPPVGPDCSAYSHLNVSAEAGNISCKLSDYLAYIRVDGMNICAAQLQQITTPSRMWRNPGNGAWLVENGVHWSNNAHIPRIAKITWDEPADKKKKI